MHVLAQQYTAGGDVSGTHSHKPEDKSDIVGYGCRSNLYSVDYITHTVVED